MLSTLVPGIVSRSLIICLSNWVFWTSQCSDKYRELLFRLGGARARWPQPPASYTVIEYSSVSAGSSLSLRRPEGLRPSLFPDLQPQQQQRRSHPNQKLLKQQASLSPPN